MPPHKIWVSIGGSKLEKSWKNQELHWPDFVNRLRKPVVTKETHAAYLALKKQDQAKIKDVGGFVGGIISGGRRVKGSVTSRFLITLDIDYAPDDFFSEVSLELDCEMVIYSTHHYSPKTPRYRLIIPLNREVLPDEYEAIARKIAGNIGIEYFDPTTFQPERLMFWPSVSSDGVYYWREQHGEWLDADAVLSEYPDWKDISQWPVSEKAQKLEKLGVDKQEDPREKGGLIGTFCRAYGVREAIEKFLNDVYDESHYDDRWTYKQGSGYAGALVYNDMFLFSHHSTDPVSGRLCNSFDLVRIHLYGSLDVGAKEGTPTGKLPSYGKMAELITADEKTKVAIIQEKTRGKVEAMGVGVGVETIATGVEPLAGTDWLKTLEMDKHGNIFPTINNVVLILTNDPVFKGNLSFDDFSKRKLVSRDLPWRKVGKWDCEWRDGDEASLRQYLEFNYGITNRNVIADGVVIAFGMRSFHPVKDYLKSLRWDGKERVERLLIDYMGAENNAYVREVTKKTFVAAVARIFEPGCKFDTVLLLVGRQGFGKSRLVAKLAGEWFSDTFGRLDNKEGMESIQGVWIMELAELAGLKRAEVEAVKHFIAKRTDRFRFTWGKNTLNYPRQCVFIGTTNNWNALQDQTGNRRWWPVVVGESGLKKAKELSDEDVKQVWAECCYLYVMGESLYLDEEIESMAGEVQAEHTVMDDRNSVIQQYLEKKLPADWAELDHYKRIEYLNDEDELAAKGTEIRTWVTVDEIWLEAFRGKASEMTPYNTQFIRDYMNKLSGWKPKYLNKKPWGYRRGWSKILEGSGQ